MMFHNRIRFTDWRATGFDDGGDLEPCEYLSETFQVGAELAGIDIGDPHGWRHVLLLSPHFNLARHHCGNGLDYFYNTRTGKVIPSECCQKVGWAGAEVYTVGELKRIRQPHLARLRGFFGEVTIGQD